MKHIKGYKIFESNEFINEIERDVNDILLEIIDIGYDVITDIITYIPNKNALTINITYPRDSGVRTHNYPQPYKKPIKLEEVKDCVNRIVEYLNSKNQIEMAVYFKSSNGNNFDIEEDSTPIEDLEVWKSYSIYIIRIICYFDKTKDVR